MKLIKALYFLILSCIIFSNPQLLAQEDLENWMHHGIESEFANGIRSNEWYSTATSGNSRTVIVAILDSGVDTEHPDLKPNIWVNPQEIPGNGKDDDGNGYTDDIHGWNFIGGPDGRDVIDESFEVTRLYGKEREKWEGVDPGKLRGKKKKEYEAFLEKKNLVETKIENAYVQIAQVKEMEQIVLDALKAAQRELGGDSLDIERLALSTDEDVEIAVRIIRNVEEQGVKVPSLEWLMDVAEEQFREQLASSEKTVSYNYNPDYDSRLIVGDTYEDFSQRYYGNNQVGGDFALHGTHVAGIVGAVRGNGIGTNGVADQVALMSVKIVPDGDERDKDVANAIRYAVDNGALVINMSFGKGFSPEKHLVDQAMKYAAKHDVLLVIGAGNEGDDIDKSPKYPTDEYVKKPLLGAKQARNVLSVGALAPQKGEYAVGEFSNYGKNSVDIFAPGTHIYSTAPDNDYQFLSGTSMAAPVVSGVAALIRSRYPDLSAPQVKDIIIKSARKLAPNVIQPGTFELVPSRDLCVSGGMVDVVSAMKLAAATKGKAKKNKRNDSSNYEPGTPRV